MKIYCDASNMHTGGGRTLILDLIDSTYNFEDKTFIIFVDKRLVIEKFNIKNVKLVQVNKFLRLFISFYLIFKTHSNDCVIYLGNIPPIFSCKCYTILYMGNRYLIDWVSTSKFNIKSRIRINIERVLFYLFHNNVNKIIVQSKSMHNILKKRIKNISKCYIYPFVSNDLIRQKTIIKTKKYDFIYIASDEPHKNHINLIDSWINLSKENYYPSLCLVLPIGSFLIEVIKKIKDKNAFINITIKHDLNREEITSILKSSRALIFPSYFESFGLPIVEAMSCDIDIVASEKDFVRDLVDPSETFDPSSLYSISRAVKRYLSIDDLKTKVNRTTDFISFILKKNNE